MLPGKPVTFGVTVMAVDPPDRFVSLVREVEQLGYDYMWVADSSLHARYVYVYLTLLATHSLRLRFGPNCTHPYTRHPAVNLSALTTLDELSGGRAVMNIGVGGGPVAELGFKRAPVRVVREMVEGMRLLLTGQEVQEFRGEAFGLRKARLLFPDRRDLPIYITASGPKMLQLAGEVADGVVYEAGTDPACLRFAHEQIRRGAALTPRPEGSLDLRCCVFGSLRESRAEAIEECRPVSAWLSTTCYGEIAGLPPQLVHQIRGAYTAGHFSEARAAGDLLEPHMIDKFTIAGPSSYWIEQLRALRELGVEHFEIFPAGKDRFETVRILGERVMPEVRRQ